MNLLPEAAIYLAAAMLAVPLFRRLGLGAVLGYLAAGVMIGPWGLGLIGETEAVMRLAEIGIVFLLFVIGLELKPARLWAMRSAIFAAGTAQLLAAGVPLVLLAHYIGLDWPVAVLVGFGLAMSSTAFVLQTLGEKKQLGASHGRAAFGVLLFQDLAVIPMLALLPLLGEQAVAADGSPFWLRAVQALAAMLGLVVGGRYLLRPVFRAAARWGSEETFTVAALLVVLGAALLMEWAGLSLGLGAFLAGVLLADSEYRHELEGNINPFKGLLLGLFFISVGMTANLGAWMADYVFILAGTACLLAVKAATMFLVARALGLGHPTAPRLALVLAQGGEFAFVLFHAASAYHLLPHEVSDRFVAVVILSMILTPALFALSDWIGRRAEAEKPREPFDAIEDENPPVIIAGFGRVGQIVARVLQMRGIRFTALERDVEHVALVRRFGNKVYYGEPTNLETLRAAGAASARLLVIAIDDVERSIRAVELARRHFPKLKIYARARDRYHAMHLVDLGVDYQIRETWLSSLAMAREVLKALGDNEADAAWSTQVFEEADQNMLERQRAHRHDEARMIQTANEVRDELKELLENDPRMSALGRHNSAQRRSGK